MILFSILFLISSIAAPWWVTLALALFIAPHRYALPVLAFGGALMDSLLGAPIMALGTLSVLYTGIFIIIALVARTIAPLIYE